MVAMPLTNLTNQSEEYYSFRIFVEGIFHNFEMEHTLCPYYKQLGSGLSPQSCLYY